MQTPDEDLRPDREDSEDSKARDDDDGIDTLDSAGDPTPPYVLVPEIEVEEVLEVKTEPVEVEAEPVEVEAEVVEVQAEPLSLGDLASVSSDLAADHIPEISVEEVPDDMHAAIFGAPTSPQAADAEAMAADGREDATEFVQTPTETAIFELVDSEETIGAEEGEGGEEGEFRLADEDLLESEWSWEEGQRGGRRRGVVRRLWPVAAAVAAAAVLVVALSPNVRSMLLPGGDAPGWQARADRKTPPDDSGTDTSPGTDGSAGGGATAGGGGGTPDGTSGGEEPIGVDPSGGTSENAADGEARLVEAVRRCLSIGLELPESE